MIRFQNQVRKQIEPLVDRSQHAGSIHAVRLRAGQSLTKKTNILHPDILRLTGNLGRIAVTDPSLLQNVPDRAHLLKQVIFIARLVTVESRRQSDLLKRLLHNPVDLRIFLFDVTGEHLGNFDCIVLVDDQPLRPFVRIYDQGVHTLTDRTARKGAIDGTNLPAVGRDRPAQRQVARPVEPAQRIVLPDHAGLHPQRIPAAGQRILPDDLFVELAFVHLQFDRRPATRTHQRQLENIFRQQPFHIHALVVRYERNHVKIRGVNLIFEAAGRQHHVHSHVSGRKRRIRLIFAARAQRKNRCGQTQRSVPNPFSQLHYTQFIHNQII